MHTLNNRLQLLERRLSTNGNSNSGLGKSPPRNNGGNEVKSPNSNSKSASTLHLSHQTPPQSKAGTSNPGQVHGSGFVYNTNSLYSSINSTEGENGEAVKAGVTTVGFPPPMLGMNENSNSMSHSSFSKDLVSLPLETVQSVVYGHLKQVTGNGDGQQVVTSSVVGETPPEDAKKKKRKSVPKKNERAKRQKEVSSQPTPITNTAKQHISFNSPSDSATPAATPTPTTDDEKKGAKHKSSKSIQDFFNPQATTAVPHSSGGSPNPGKNKGTSEKKGSSNEIKALLSQVAELTSLLKTQTTQNSDTTQKLQQLIEENTRKTTAENKQKATIMEDLVRSNNTRELSELKHSLALSSSRLGTLKYERVGGGISGERLVEVWEDGFAAKKLKENQDALKERRTLLERRQKDAKKQVKKLANQKAGEMPPPPPKADQEAATGGMTVMDELEAMEAEESVRAHLAALKKREAELADEEKLLDTEKIMHLRALKRVANEDASRFQSRPKLHDRYLLLNLLGKGGFSEVWRAHDMVEFRDVAVKIHQLDARWSEDKKRNYTKHVSREYEIHRDVRHPRIVSLLDVFEIDHNSFATVLEYCKGTDLDTMLKEQKTIPEREARAILLQVLTGMRYLNVPSPDGSRQGIIHYDLKPGNILFDEFGDAKITDFGLSKIVDTENDGDSLELTSQGAGTYWYLPPECFMTGKAVRISNKVDVWSMGVIYYQMLYGKRPFGDGQSQDKVLSNNLILNATEVKFPMKPQVSKEGKDFISELLSHNQVLRPDMLQVCGSQYLKIKGKL